MKIITLYWICIAIIFFIVGIIIGNRNTQKFTKTLTRYTIVDSSDALRILELEKLVKEQKNLIYKLSRDIPDHGTSLVVNHVNQSLDTENSKLADILSINPKERNEKRVDLEDSSPVEIFATLPESHVWCNGNNRDDRVCKFRNLCYHPEQDMWFILKTNGTVQKNVPFKNRYDGGLLDLTSIANHTVYFWNYVEASPYEKSMQNVLVRYEEDLHFIFSRLHPSNIMHNLHDDALPLYHLLKEYLGGRSLNESNSFNLNDHRILIFDAYLATDSTKPIQYMSNKPLRFKRYLTQRKELVFTCFKDAVVGQSKLTTWYQYGFDEPQGPLSAVGKFTNGMHVREVAEWFVRRLGISLEKNQPENTRINETIDEKSENLNPEFQKSDLIVIMSRRRNRLILNEQELAAKLSAEFKLDSVFLRNEDLPFEQQIKILQRARIVLAMHGSILVMAMFCRRGTIIIEMFPYAVPSENYTPYKTMAELQGMDLIYRAWENKHLNASVSHPNRPKLAGGIQYLPHDVREQVKNSVTVPIHNCCENPYWLYRIYQDTAVNIPEVIAVIRSGLEEFRSKSHFFSSSGLLKPRLLTPVINRATCVQHSTRPAGSLWASWLMPWTGINVEQFKVLIYSTGREYLSLGNATSVAIDGFRVNETVEFFIAIKSDGQWGEWGGMCECKV